MFGNGSSAVKSSQNTTPSEYTSHAEVYCCCPCCACACAAVELNRTAMSIDLEIFRYPSAFTVKPSGERPPKRLGHSTSGAAQLGVMAFWRCDHRNTPSQEPA